MNNQFNSTKSTEFLSQENSLHIEQLNYSSESTDHTVPSTHTIPTNSSASTVPLNPPMTSNYSVPLSLLSEEDQIEAELEKGLLKKYQKRDGLPKRKLKSFFLNKDMLEKRVNSYISDEDFDTKNNSKKNRFKKISFKRFNKLSSIIKLPLFNNISSLNQASSFNENSSLSKISPLINPSFSSHPSLPSAQSFLSKATKMGAYLSLSALIGIYALDASANVGFKINDATTAAFDPIINGIKAHWGKAVTMAGIGGVFLSEGDGRTRAIKAGIGAGCMGGFILLMLSLFG